MKDKLANIIQYILLTEEPCWLDVQGVIFSVFKNDEEKEIEEFVEFLKNFDSSKTIEENISVENGMSFEDIPEHFKHQYGNDYIAYERFADRCFFNT